MEKIDVLVKGVPVPIHNIFKGYCSMTGKSESEGIIDAMISVIEKNSVGGGGKLESIVNEYQLAARQK